MEINLRKIKEMFKGKGSSSSVHFSWKHNPSRDWQIVSAIFLVLLICSAVWSYIFFFGVANGEIFLVEQKTLDTSNLLDREKLNVAMEKFNERAVRFDNLKSNAPSVSDPSL